MRVYLDVCCLGRPFDDRSQARIRLEAEAVTWILERCDRGEWSQVSSQMAQVEIAANRDTHRRDRVRLLLPEERAVLKLNQGHFDRAVLLEKLGFKPADALHVAAAEDSGTDILLSCDDRLCRLAQRRRRELMVRVANPLDWLKEIGHGSNP